jgi:hypothetical protein
MKINIHIERVILEGVSGDHSRLLRRSLETELERHVSRGGLSEELLNGTAVASLRGGNVNLDRTSDPGTIGAGIARGVYLAFGHAGSGRTRGTGGKTAPEQSAVKSGGESK